MLADIGVALSLTTAILYYFGWVRTRFQARELGFDVSALDLSTTDYLLKSLNVLFVPLIGLALVGLLAYTIHSQAVAPAVAGGRRACSLVARLLAWAWLPLAVVAVLMMLTPVRGYAIPVWLTLSVLCAQYGRCLRRLVTGTDPWERPTRLLVVALLILAVFWTTERVARTAGEMYGTDYVNNPYQLPAVSVYSAKDIHLSGPGVVSEPLTGKESAFTFRYSGLRLLERSGDRFFFITTVPGRVVVLREGDGMRMEFTEHAK